MTFPYRQGSHGCWACSAYVARESTGVALTWRVPGSTSRVRAHLMTCKDMLQSQSAKVRGAGEITHLPMGCMATRPRRSVCPVSVCSSRPEAAHSRAVVSAPPVARIGASSDCPGAPACGCHASPAASWKPFNMIYPST